MKKRTQVLAQDPSALPSNLAWPCLRLDCQGRTQSVILDLSISPDAKSTEVVGWHDGALRIRLAAPPTNGEANAALHRWLSQQMALPISRIELLRGAKGRRKQWAIKAEAVFVSRWITDQVQAGNSASNIVKPM